MAGRRERANAGMVVGLMIIPWYLALPIVAVLVALLGGVPMLLLVEQRH